MPRDGSGNYTLPAGNPVVTGTLIDSVWANNTMSDIAVQMNNVLTRDGVLGPVGSFKLVDGAVNTPGLGFNSEPGLGLYRVGTTLLGFSAAGQQICLMDASNPNANTTSLFPRATGTSQSSLVLSNQPSGSSNRSDLILQVTSTGVALVSQGYGTGTVLPLLVTSTNFNLSSAGALTLAQGLTASTGTFSGNVSVFSDKRLKTHISESKGALRRLGLLTGYSYIKDEREDRGVIAQEVACVYPELVTLTPSGFLSVNYNGLVAELIQAVNELNAKVDAL